MCVMFVMIVLKKKKKKRYKVDLPRFSENKRRKLNHLKSSQDKENSLESVNDSRCNTMSIVNIIGKFLFKLYKSVEFKQKKFNRNWSDGCRDIFAQS